MSQNIILVLIFVKQLKNIKGCSHLAGHIKTGSGLDLVLGWWFSKTQSEEKGSLRKRKAWEEVVCLLKVGIK